MVHSIECLFEVKEGLRKKRRNNKVSLQRRTEGATSKREHAIDSLNRLVNYDTLQLFPMITFISSILYAPAFFSTNGWDTIPSLLMHSAL